MNEATVRLLAKQSRTYSARRITRRISVHAVDPRQDNWIVWCSVSDHHVEFDPETIRQAAAANERHPLPLSGTR